MTTLANRLLQSSTLLLISKFIERSLGLVSTLILARILVPEDFGTVAIVAIVLQFFEVISSSGPMQYLIQKEQIGNDDVHTAWTLNLIFKISIFIVLIPLIPIISNYYDNESLESALYVASSILIINGFENQAINILRKNLNYSSITKLTITRKFIAFSVAMIMVAIEPSFWALIIADIVSSLIHVIGSHLIYPFKIKFGLKKAKLQWNFSKWIILKSAFGYSRAQLDTFLITTKFNLDNVGKYHIIKNLTSIPANDIIAPAVEPLLSAFSEDKNNSFAIKRKIETALIALTFITFPMLAFLVTFPIDVVTTILGKKWIETTALLQWLSLLIYSYAIGRAIESALISLGKIKQIFYFDVASMLLMALSLTQLPLNSIESFAAVRIAINFILLCLLISYLKALTQIRLSIISGYIVFSATLSLVSSALTFLIHFFINSYSIWLFLSKGIIFVAIYLAIIFSISNLFSGKLTYLSEIKNAIVGFIANKFLTYRK